MATIEIVSKIINRKKNQCQGSKTITKVTKVHGKSRQSLPDSTISMPKQQGSLPKPLKFIPNHKNPTPKSTLNQGNHKNHNPSPPQIIEIYKINTLIHSKSPKSQKSRSVPTPNHRDHSNNRCQILGIIKITTKIASKSVQPK